MPALEHVSTILTDDPPVNQAEFTYTNAPSVPVTLPAMGNNGTAVAVRDSLIGIDDIPGDAETTQIQNPDFESRRGSIPMITPQPSWAQDLPVSPCSESDPSKRKPSVVVLDDVIKPNPTGVGSKIAVAGARDASTSTRRQSAMLQLLDENGNATAIPEDTATEGAVLSQAPDF